MNVIKYATRFPPGKDITLLDNGNVRKIARFNEDKTSIFMEALIKHFIRNPDPLVVPVYNYIVIDSHSYSYEMERLGILSKEDKYFIDKIGSVMDIYGRDAWFEAQHNIINWIDNKNLIQFAKTIIENYKYYDFHSGNVMMDTEFNYRLVDLEGFINTPLELYANDWITRE
jgi:hypothetical protein